MHLFTQKYTANEWHKTFIVLPKTVITLTLKGDRRVVETKTYFLCFMQRKFVVVNGRFSLVEYRPVPKHDHVHCKTNCYKPGCEAPINLTNFRGTSK